MTDNKTPVSGEFISTSELAARYKRSSRTIWRWTNTSTFPKPTMSCQGSEALWRTSDIEEWEANGMQLRA